MTPIICTPRNRFIGPKRISVASTPVRILWAPRLTWQELVFDRKTGVGVGHQEFAIVPAQIAHGGGQHFVIEFSVEPEDH